MALAELGKLLTVDLDDSSPSPSSSTNMFPPKGANRLKLAHETLVRALVELDIGFGKGGGEVGEEVRALARGAEKELAIWGRGVRNVRENA